MNTIKYNLGGRDNVVGVVPSLWTGRPRFESQQESEI